MDNNIRLYPGVYEDGDKHETSVDYYSDGIIYPIDGIEVTEATYPSGFAGASPDRSVLLKFQMMLLIKFITLIEL